MMADHTVEANRKGVVGQGEDLSLRTADSYRSTVDRRPSISKHGDNTFNSFIKLSTLVVIVFQLIFISGFCLGHLFDHGWFSSSPALYADTGSGEGRSMLSTGATYSNLNPGSNCTKIYSAAEGETCTSLRRSQRLSQAQIFELNPGLNCKTLTKGQAICVQGISAHCGRAISVIKGPTNTTCASIIRTYGNISTDGFLLLNPGISCPEAVGNNNSWPSSHLVCVFPGLGNIFFEYMGASGQPITFGDVAPLVQKFSSTVYHVILSFAIDVDANGTRTNGTYYPYWSNELTPAAAKAFKAANPNVQILMSLGGASKWVNENITVDIVWEDPPNATEWIDTAQSSLTAIAEEYSIDGIDIDYENFGHGSTKFAFCMATLIERLKRNNTIGLATIAPFGAVLPEYLNFMKFYGLQVDYVNFQFYAYQLHTVQKYVSEFNTIADQFPPWKLLASTQTGGNNSIKGTLFVDAVDEIKQIRGLAGVMLYDADGSLPLNFTYEKEILSVLNGGTGSLTPVPAPSSGPSPAPRSGSAPTPGGPAPTPRAPGSGFAPAPTRGGPTPTPGAPSSSHTPTPGAPKSSSGPAPAPKSRLAPAPTPGAPKSSSGPAPAPKSRLAPAPTPGAPKSSSGPAPAPKSRLAPAPTPGAPKSSSRPAPGPKSGSAPAPNPGAPKSGLAPELQTPTPAPSSAHGRFLRSRWSAQVLGLVTTVFVLLISL